jgi:hypothetical protein
MRTGSVLLATSLAIVGPVATAMAQDWNTGSYRFEWSDGKACIDNGTCFEIHQPGVGRIGLFGTQNCWRHQVWTTIIQNAPANIDKFDVLEASGRWNYGVRSVDFVDGKIVVSTFVIQDHGGTGNPCLQPGQGDFTLRFSSSKR